MDKIYYIKEDQKNSITEPNIKRKSNSIEKFFLRNRLSYTKKVQRKHLINIHKLLSKEKNETTQTKKSFLPIFSSNISNINNSSKKFKDSGYSNYSHYYTIQKEEDYVEKEKLIMEIFRIEEEIKTKNEEIEEYKDNYKKLQEQNLTYQTIIERILDNHEETQIETEPNIQNIEERNKSKEQEKKISRLKLHILNYNKAIKKKEKVLDETKIETKISNFINFNLLIKKKK